MLAFNRLPQSSSSELHGEDAVETNNMHFFDMELDGLVHDRREDSIPGAHHGKASWITIAFVQIADIVGTGVLALGVAFGDLGWLLGLVSIVIFLPINIFNGLLLHDCKMAKPKAKTYTDLSLACFEGPWMTTFVGFLFNTSVYGTTGVYLQTLGNSLSEAFAETILCGWQWTLIAGIVLIPLCQIRTFQAGRALYFLNALSIVLTVLISCVYMWVSENPSEEPVETEWLLAELDWVRAFSGINTIAYSYYGQAIYLEMIDELEEPGEFPKTFYISAPYELFFFMLAGCTQYAFQGKNASGQINEVLPKNSTISKLVAVLLAFHVTVSYLVNANILTKGANLRLFNGTTTTPGMKGVVEWFLSSLVVYLVSFFIANAVPNFVALIGFIGAFNAPLLGYILPGIFFFRCVPRVHINASKRFAVKCTMVTGVIMFFAGLAAALAKIEETFQEGQRPFACI